MEILYWELELVGVNGDYVSKRVFHEKPKEFGGFLVWETHNGGSFAYLDERVLSFSVEPVAAA